MYAFYLNKTHENLNTYTFIILKKHFPNATLNTLAGPGLPPNGRVPMIFYGQTAKQNYFFLI